MDILQYIHRINQLYGSEPVPMPAPRYNTQQYLQGGRVGKKPGGLVEPGVTHYARPVSEDRMAQLNEAAKKYGYKSFDDIKDRQIKTNVSKDATRRAEGVVEGKGKTKPTEAQKATMKEAHWTKTKSKADVKKIISSKAYKAYHLRRVADQINILKAV